MKKRLLCAIVAAILLLTACGCQNPNVNPSDTDGGESGSSALPTDSQTQPQESETEPEVILDPQEISIKESLDKIKVHGRSMETTYGISADWSASGIEFALYCKGDVQITMSATIACTFYPIIDGETKGGISIGTGTKTYTIAKNLPLGNHTIRFIKKNAVEWGNSGMNVSLNTLHFSGELLDRPADAPYLIEFIGDSITCGVGLSADNTPNSIETFAYRLSSEVGADYSFVSVSGIGLHKSTSRHNGLNMLKVYPRTSFYRSKTELYTPTRQADLVVINLNANDKGQVNYFTEQEYKESARQLIAKIKELHGEDVKIIWIFGMYNAYGTCDIWATEVLEELGGAAAGYYTYSTGYNNMGSDNHPNLSKHKQVTRDLKNLIEQNNILPTLAN